MADKASDTSAVKLHELKEKLRTVVKIDNLVTRHNVRTQTVAALALASIGVCTSVYISQPVRSLSPELNSALNLALGILFAAVFWVVTRKTFKLGADLLEEADAALAEYEPVDGAALAILQTKLKEPGDRVHDEILTWTAEEQERLRYLIGLATNANQKRFRRFLSREIPIERPAA